MGGQQPGMATMHGTAMFRICVGGAYGSFLRTFVLPSNADADSIDASVKQGVLKLSIPKSAESKAKTVDVKAD